MKKKVINCVITDLDDTLWGWLDMWYGSFQPYYDGLLEKFELSEEELQGSFRRLHQNYGTSEVSFAYKELDCLTENQKDKVEKKGRKKKDLLHQFYSNKKKNLKLLKDVRETLNQLKQSGVLIVGFTESNSFFTKYRLKHLKLDGLIDYVYAPIGTGIPQSVVKHYESEHWEPKLTEFRYLSNSVHKPDKDILDIITLDFNLKKKETIYIGDKLDRDVMMAQESGIHSVFAKYGHKIDGKKYDLLKAVTHWTDADVEREVKFKKSLEDKKIIPDSVITSYSDILEEFDFKEHHGRIDENRVSEVIEIWKEVVSVQKHFNDLELRVRAIAISAFTFMIAAIGYLIVEKSGVRVLHIPVHSLIAFAGAIITLLFWLMDQGWYHRLLKGAVKQGEWIEKKWKPIVPEMGLAKRISKSSGYRILRINFNSNKKYLFFYLPLIGLMIFLGILGLWI